MGTTGASTAPPQLWWLEMSDDARSIVAARPIDRADGGRSRSRPHRGADALCRRRSPGGHPPRLPGTSAPRRGVAAAIRPPGVRLADGAAPRRDRPPRPAPGPARPFNSRPSCSRPTARRFTASRTRASLPPCPSRAGGIRRRRPSLLVVLPCSHEVSGALSTRASGSSVACTSTGRGGFAGSNEPSVFADRLDRGESSGPAMGSFAAVR